ncbi:MAG TPA: hypothetical protein EYQ74_07890 [Planctomycetes bacterium]|nr:hypothetical protein [Planctomycetota bacterium]HIK59800.1 hypothetical protein [Planctomycetota bacterium]
MHSLPTQDPSGVGPSVLLIPVLVGMLGIFWARSRNEGPFGERPVAPQEGTVELVNLWTGGLEFPGGRLVAELGALHLDPARQEQDARILESLFDLPEGQPWRLRVRLEAEDQAVLDPAELQVVSDGSACLAPLRPIPSSAGHPLLPLLAASPRSLGGPSPTDVILWGQEPGATALLEGLRGFGGGGSIELARAPGTPWNRYGELASRGGESAR